MKGRLSKLVFCVFFIAFVVLSQTSVYAVKAGDTTSLSSTMPVSEIYKFENLPTPKDYKLDEKQSFAFQSGDLKVGFLIYKGKSSADMVSNFFRDEMPKYGWKLVSLIEHHERVLNFESQDQTCVIMVSGDGKIVKIAIAPRQ